MSESQTYAEEMRWILSAIAAGLEGLSPGQLDARPNIADTNSPAVIAGHVMGVARAYILNMVCGQSIGRNRPLEFQTRLGSAGEAIDALKALGDEIATALLALDPEQLSIEFRPASELWGTNVPERVSRRATAVHAIRHSALHLGELRLTVAMLNEPASDPPIQG